MTSFRAEGVAGEAEGEAAWGAAAAAAS
eukprot:SAG11_NODE_28119_length_325_cov_0.898230_1_plen_27_part_10